MIKVEEYVDLWLRDRRPVCDNLFPFSNLNDYYLFYYDANSTNVNKKSLNKMISVIIILKSFNVLLPIERSIKIMR